MRKKLIISFWLCSLSAVSFTQQLTHSAEKQWFCSGPYSVYINCLDVSKSDSNTVYLGSYGHGVFVSTDKGLSWQSCSTEDWPVFTDSVHISATQVSWWFGPYPPVTFISVDPGDSKHVYIGLYEQGLRESSDGGETWKTIATEIPTEAVYTKLLIDEKNTDEFFLVGSRIGGLYRSKDHGQTWQVIDSVPHGEHDIVNDIVRDPLDKNHLLVTYGPNTYSQLYSGIMESYDNGITWSVVNDKYRFRDICINPENSNHLLATINSDYLGWQLLKSTDGGLNFEFQYPSNFINYSTSLYKDDQGHLFLTGEGYYNYLYFSADFGVNWQPIDSVTHWSGLYAPHQVRSTPGGFYYGNHYGFYFAETPTAKKEIRNGTINNSYIYNLAVDPSDNQILYAAGEQGLWKSVDGANSWVQLADWTVNSIAIDPQHSDTIYYGGDWFRRSFDGGRTFEQSDPYPWGRVFGIAINPVHTNIVYCNAGSAFLKSLDYGTTWETLVYYDNDYPIIIDPNHPDTLYLGVSRSVDGGKHWKSIDKNVVKVQPGNSNKLYALYMDQLDVSEDWGLTWKTLDNYELYPPAVAGRNKFYLDEDNDQNLYYATGHGIRYSTDGGNTWDWFKGPFNTRALEIVAMPEKNIYYVATHGYGVWAYNYFTDLRQIQVKRNINDQNLQAYPNPFSDKVKISGLPGIKGKLEIYNLVGQMIYHVEITQYEHEYIWNTKNDSGINCPVGMYLAVYYTIDGWTKSMKIVKL